jgi:RNA polymerase sigma-70 factor (ECF subfamily)
VRASDEELVARVVGARDATAFAELVRRHQGRVRGWLRQLTRDPALADDLAQDTFVRAFDRLAQFSGKGRLEAWLMRIAYTEFLQAKRRLAREREVLEAARPPLEPRVAERHPGEAARELETLLGVLGEDERRVMTLAYAYELSHAEIAEVTGLALGTVKSHIHRAKRRIRERFELTGDAS